MHVIRERVGREWLLLIVLALVILPLVAAANNPGHDTLYIEQVGDSNLTGKLNISEWLRVGKLFYTTYLDIQGNGTQPGNSRAEVYADASTALIFNAPGNFYFGTGSGTMVYIGTSGVDLNVSRDVYIGGFMNITGAVNATGKVYSENNEVCTATNGLCADGAGNSTAQIIAAVNNSGISITGNAATATALAANGANCDAGSYATGVDASGAAEGCTVAGTGTVTGSGTQNKIPVWSNAGGTELGDSLLSQSGSTVTVAGNLSMPTTFWIGNSAIAKGTNSVAIGTGAKANYSHSIAIGDGANASAADGNAIAIGQYAKSSAWYGTAIGNSATSSGETSTAIGQSSTASGTNGVAIGWGATASGGSSTALGKSATASGNYGNAIGYVATASNTGAIATGYYTNATQTYATAIGYSTKASATDAIALGRSAVADQNYAVALGYGANTNATNQFMIGSATQNLSLYVMGDIYVAATKDICTQDGKCLSTTGTGSGDVTGVTAGTGINVTSATGPVPTVSVNATWLDARYLQLTTNHAGDVSGAYNAMVVADNSHAHDAANITAGNLAVARMPTGGAWALSSDLNIDGNKLFVNASAAKVGIGTAAPNYTLHVYGGEAKFSNGVIITQSSPSVALTVTDPGTAGGITATSQAIGIEGTSSLNYGVKGQTTATSTGSAGVFGYSQSEGLVYGVYGQVTDTNPDSAGVYGYGADSGKNGAKKLYGVYGLSSGTTSESAGVYGNASATSGEVYGVKGYTASAAGYSGYFTGGLGVKIADGNLTMGSGLVGIHTASPGAMLEINSSAAATTGLLVKGAAAQSANLTEWQSSAGAKLASVNATGSFFVGNDAVCTAANGLCANSSSYYSSAGGWTNTTTTTTTALNVVMSSSHVNITGDNTSATLLVKGVAGQTAVNLTEWQSSAGAILAYLNASGSLFVENGNRVCTADNGLCADGSGNSTAQIIAAVNNTGINIGGTAAKATALAANGANCDAGSYATGVDASGAAEGCTVAATGDVTGVTAGTGINVTDPNGPVPTVSVNATWLDARYLQLTTNHAGDVSGAYNAMVVADNSHNHDAANITAGTLNSARLPTTLVGWTNDSANTNTSLDVWIVKDGPSLNLYNNAGANNSYLAFLGTDGAGDQDYSWFVGTADYDNEFYIYNAITGKYTYSIDRTTDYTLIGHYDGANPALGTLHVKAQASTDTATIIQGAADQSANLTEWRNSSGAVLASVNGTGVLTLRPNHQLVGDDLDQSFLDFRNPNGNVLAVAGKSSADDFIFNVGNWTTYENVWGGGDTFTVMKYDADSSGSQGFAALVTADDDWTNSSYVDLNVMQSDGGIHTSSLAVETHQNSTSANTFNVYAYSTSLSDRGNERMIVDVSSATGKASLAVTSGWNNVHDIFALKNGTTMLFNVSTNGNVNVSGDLLYGGDLIGYGADVAEMIDGEVSLEPGDVVVIDENKDEAVVKSSKAYDSLVAGIVSTDPSHVLAAGDGNVKLALAGRVPVKVTTSNGAIKRGDLLTTSDVPGTAMRCADKSLCAGAILGKALEPLDSGTGKITALVMLG